MKTLATLDQAADLLRREIPNADVRLDVRHDRIGGVVLSWVFDDLAMRDRLIWLDRILDPLIPSQERNLIAPYTPGEAEIALSDD